MKKAFVVALFLLSLLPSVTAESFANILFGTSQESMLFVRIVYSLLIFIIFFKVSKESIFKEQKQAKLATVFSLIFAFLATRFTPDSWISPFGWIIAILGPFLLLFALSGIFFKEKKEEFPLGRLIFALIAGLIVILALGLVGKFSTGSSGSSSGIGGALDEAFADINYFGGYRFSNVFVWFALAFSLGLLIWLFGSIFGGWKWPKGKGKDAGGGEAPQFPKALLWLIATAVIVALVLLGLGGSLGVAAPMGRWILWGVVGFGTLFLLYHLFSKLFNKKKKEGEGSKKDEKEGEGSRFGKWLKKHWKGIFIPFIALLIIGVILFGWGWILGMFGGYWYVPVILGILLILLSIFRGLRNSKRLIIDIIANGKRISPGQTISLPFGVQRHVFVLRLTRGGARWAGKRLANAKVSVETTFGRIAPTNATSNANGEVPLQYITTGNEGQDELRIIVEYIDRTSVPQQLTLPSQPTEVIPIDIVPVVQQAIYRISVTRRNIRIQFNQRVKVRDGEKAEILVSVIDEKNIGINNATAIVQVQGQQPIRLNTTGGTTKTLGQARFIIPVLPIGTYPFTVSVQSQDFANAQGNGIIEVVGKVIPDLIVNPKSPITIIEGEELSLTISLNDKERGGINNANIRLNFPTRNINLLSQVTASGTEKKPGICVFKIPQTSSLPPGTYQFTVTATVPPNSPYINPNQFNGQIIVKPKKGPRGRPFSLVVAYGPITAAAGSQVNIGVQAVDNETGDGIDGINVIFAAQSQGKDLGRSTGRTANGGIIRIGIPTPPTANFGSMDTIIQGSLANTLTVTARLQIKEGQTGGLDLQLFR